jgi:hypothetical protein
MPQLLDVRAGQAIHELEFSRFQFGAQENTPDAQSKEFASTSTDADSLQCNQYSCILGD